MALINTNPKKNVFNDHIPGRCQDDKWSPQTSIAHNDVLKTDREKKIKGSHPPLLQCSVWDTYCLGGTVSEQPTLTDS